MTCQPGEWPKKIPPIRITERKLTLASLHQGLAFRSRPCLRSHDARPFTQEKVSAQACRPLCACAGFHRNAVIGEGILQGKRPDSGLRTRVASESWDFVVFDRESDDSPVIARCLGVQDIVREGFQELAPEFP